MKKLLLLPFITTIVLGVTVSDLAVFNTKKTKENRQASENEKIKCRYVCDKKIYKEQKIHEAVSFYKNSKEHTFTDK